MKHTICLITTLCITSSLVGMDKPLLPKLSIQELEKQVPKVPIVGKNKPCTLELSAADKKLITHREWQLEQRNNQQNHKKDVVAQPYQKEAIHGKRLFSDSTCAQKNTVTNTVAHNATPAKNETKHITQLPEHLQDKLELLQATQRWSEVDSFTDDSSDEPTKEIAGSLPTSYESLDSSAEEGSFVEDTLSEEYSESEEDDMSPIKNPFYHFEHKDWEKDIPSTLKMKKLRFLHNKLDTRRIVLVPKALDIMVQNMLSIVEFEKHHPYRVEKIPNIPFKKITVQKSDSPLDRELYLWRYTNNYFGALVSQIDTNTVIFKEFGKDLVFLTRKPTSK